MTEHIQVVPDKCRACRRCEVACIAAHHGMSFKEAMKHRDELVSRVQVVKAEGFKTTVRCHQCPHAPCVNVCPTGALQQDDQGRIIMRVQYCVACKMCMAACPYGTITMETIGMPSVDGEDGETLAQRARREVAVRCDMCRAWRVENGKRITACMEACPAHALSLVLADGTVVEAPKPEKKAVPAAAGSENAPRAEAPKAEAPKVEAPKAEAAPAGTTPSAAEAADAESQKTAAKAQEVPVATAAPEAEAPAAPDTKAASETPTAPAPEHKADAAPAPETAAPVRPEEKNAAETAPAATAKAAEAPAEQAKADEAPAAKSADSTAPSSDATGKVAPVNAQEDAAKASAEPAAQKVPEPMKTVEQPAVEEKPAAAPKAEKAPQPAAAAPKEKAAPKKSAAKSSKKTGKKSGKK